MENYYFLSWTDRNTAITSAFAPDQIKAAQDLIPELVGKNELPFELTLVKLDAGKSGITKSDNLDDVKELWVDYQPNSLAWPIMSERMRTLVDSNLEGHENIDWISCRVTHGIEARPYFILRFNKYPDVLDHEKTLFVKGTDHIIRPVFSLRKVEKLAIFSKPSSHELWKITSGIYVSQRLKKAAEKARLTGITFEKVRVA